MSNPSRYHYMGEWWVPEQELTKFETLCDLLNNTRVSLPDAVHTYECPAWREGKKHGPCDCGGDELSTRTRVALLAVGVKVLETPNEKAARLAFTAHQGPEFGDGPEFEGWAERSSNSGEVK
jgi:hypothetical protein